MRLEGIKHNRKTYSMLINGFVKLKDWANAFAIFEDVIRDGLKPDVVLYNNIIRAFCGMGNMERAISTIKQMQKERCTPTSQSFMPIIHAFAKAGDVRRALEMFDMMRRSGCIPTVHTYNALILGLVEKRKVLLLVDIGVPCIILILLLKDGTIAMQSINRRVELRCTPTPHSKVCYLYYVLS